MLANFDSVDKYMVDARMLFTNISDLKEIEFDNSYLDERQREIIKRFFLGVDISGKQSTEKSRFVSIWNLLYEIYTKYRESLQSQGLAYSGMIYRATAEAIKRGEIELSGDYAVVGFNALSTSEKVLFESLKAHGAYFFWDYDDYYVNNQVQEAGLFLRENIRNYPSQFDFGHDNFRKEKRLRVISAPTDALQCKYVNRLLHQMMADGVPMDKRTAIVLTDENLLQPLLYSMPEGVELNVTMGFPVRQTVAYSLVERLIELQNRRRESSANLWFYHSDVLGLLSHPYLSNVLGEEGRLLSREIVDNQRVYVPREELARTDLLARLFSSVAEWQQMSDYLLEMIAEASRSATMTDDALRREAQYLSVVAENIMQLRNSLNQCAVDITLPIYTSLLRRHLQTLRIPFEGEPLHGVQIMGILETRNLDFDNVIVLSMNDDNFPGNRTAASSFIPYGLRAAYGLPTPEHHEGVYACYFYRLIQRARNIYMVYCSQSDEKSSGEASRYIRQLDYESGLKIHKVDFGVDINLGKSSSFSIAKQGDVREKLERFLTDPNASLSPTALYRYIACPMRFYFASVARIRSEEEISEEIDAPMFGTILHEAMRTLYEPLQTAASTAKAIEAITDEQISVAVDRAINENYLHRERASVDDYGGNILLVRDIICRYIRAGILTYDAAHADFRVESTEHEVATPFRFDVGERELQVVFKGTADRIDVMDSGMVRVVDYKTGAPHLEFDGIESLFKGKGKQRQSNTIQTLLYSMMISHSEHRAVVPALYYVRDLGRDDYSPQLVEVVSEGRNKSRRAIESYAEYAQEFERHLAETLGEIFDLDTPFTQCDDLDTCTYCDYADICRR
jgi:hypothetical protein